MLFYRRTTTAFRTVCVVRGIGRRSFVQSGLFMLVITAVPSTSRVWGSQQQQQQQRQARTDRRCSEKLTASRRVVAVSSSHRRLASDLESFLM